jgi:Tfp pilus assembly protein PilN
MIRINLAKRKTASSGGGAMGAMGALGALGATRGGSGIGSLKLPIGLSKITLDTDRLKEIPIKKFLVSIVIGVGATFYSDNQKEVEMQKATEIVTQLTTERAQLTNAAGKLKSYENMKKSMELDEATIRGKIDTIQMLIVDRTNPPKLLSSLSVSIPKDVWLAEFKAGEKDVTFRGLSFEFDHVTEFIKSLNESAYFTEVGFKPGTGAPRAKDEIGVDVYSFDLTGKRR